VDPSLGGVAKGQLPSLKTVFVARVFLSKFNKNFNGHRAVPRLSLRVGQAVWDSENQVG
jgi:hypothetical protein